MANDNFTQQALANDPTFKQRLKASMSRVSQTILGESTGTTGHAARVAYARAFIANPEGVINSLVQYFVFSTNVFAATTSVTFDGRGGTVVQSLVTDSALDSQLTTDWNNLAGV